MSEIAVISENVKVIVFQLMGKEYAIPVSQVRSIEKVQHITRVPKAAPFVKGVINLRGVVTPVIDLRIRFSLPEDVHSEDTRVIIAGVNDKEVGLVVDAANDVLDIPSEAIESQPEVVGAVEADYISGVAKLEKRLLVLLNLEEVLN
ncbi:chemotaxis protein CheW [Rossellomorea vietnamensis]|uniref:Chemotaxis protein CheW n=1 Tax=Rossellomorea vietnamensis TaxID=218284 RepID=A0A5D4NTX6_9BACI|nr:chemotaxis protein CheW [Rossellomorea vietnamensis]TYS16262.1 chemotaxis protein CheW [Rossellomorea vietnamensis]